MILTNRALSLIAIQGLGLEHEPLILPSPASPSKGQELGPMSPIKAQIRGPMDDGLGFRVYGGLLPAMSVIRS